MRGHNHPDGLGVPLDGRILIGRLLLVFQRLVQLVLVVHTVHDAERSHRFAAVGIDFAQGTGQLVNQVGGVGDQAGQVLLGLGGGLQGDAGALGGFIPILFAFFHTLQQADLLAEGRRLGGQGFQPFHIDGRFFGFPQSLRQIAGASICHFDIPRCPPQHRWDNAADG